MENLFKVDPKAGLPGNQPIQGLTKREYFAAMAMQGLLATPGNINIYKILAEESVMQANALVEALNNTDNPKLQP
jgi:hypothetical protein